MFKPQFANNEIYHIYNRGVEKREVFMEDTNYRRFLHDLFEFNDVKPVFNVDYYFNPESSRVEPRHSKHERKPRKLLVEILAFVLMPNHYHLLLRQKREGGIVKFMQKIGAGYTNYFNKKYARVGSLFQGRFKAVLVKEEAHFIHLPFYIHANPLSLLQTKPSAVNAKRLETKTAFLEKYRWSSFPDYIGKENYPSITSRDFLLELWGGEEKYKKATEDWLEGEGENVELISEVIMENYGSGKLWELNSHSFPIVARQLCPDLPLAEEP